MPPVVVAVAAGVAAGVAAASVVVGVAVAIGTIALTVAMKPEMPKGLAEDIERAQTLSTGSVIPRRGVYGETVVSGTIVGYGKRIEGIANNAKEYHVVAVAIAGHHSESLSIYKVNDKEPPEGTLFRAYLGDQTKVDPVLRQIVTGWTDNHIGRGVTYALVQLPIDQEKLPQGLRNITFKIKGKKVYDPRKDSSIGGNGTHRHDNPATWEWSDNPVLCAFDFLRFQGYRQQPISRFDLADIAAEANVCDELVQIERDGVTVVEKRFTCNGSWTYDEGPADVLQRILTSCAGKPYRRGGKMYVKTASYHGPAVLEITTADLAGRVKYRPNTSERERCNVVRATYIDPEAGYITSESPVLRVDEYVTTDGAIREHEIRLPFTNSNTMAQRLQKYYLERNRAGFVVEATVGPKGLLAEPGKTVALNLAEDGIVGEFIVADWNYDQTKKTVSLVLIIEQPELYGDEIHRRVVRPIFAVPDNTTVAPPQQVAFAGESSGRDFNGLLTWQHPAPATVEAYIVRIYSDPNTQAQGDEALIIEQRIEGTRLREYPVRDLPTGDYIMDVLAVSKHGKETLPARIFVPIYPPAAPTGINVSAGNFDLTIAPVASGLSYNSAFEFDIITGDAIPAGYTPTAKARGITAIFTGLQPNSDYRIFARTVSPYGVSAWVNRSARTAFDQSQLAPFIDDIREEIERLNTVELAQLRDDLEQAKQDLENIPLPDLAPINAEIARVEGLLGQLQTNLNNSLNTLSGNLQTLDGELSTLEQQSAANNQALNTAQQNLNALSGDLSTLSSDLSALSTDLSARFPIKTADITDSAINAAKLASSAVTAAKLASSAVTADKIAALAVNADKIAANAVTTAKIADAAIAAGKIAAGAVGTDTIAELAITAEKVAALAINATKLADNAVTNAKLDALAVTEAKIASNAISAAKIASSAVTEAKIATNAITAVKVAAGAITEVKIATAAITADKVADLAINEAKIAANAVTVGKVADGAIAAGKIALGAVTEETIAALAITAAKVADNAVTVNKIAPGAVVESKIADAAITSLKVADLAINADKVAANAITSAKIAAGAVSAGKIAANAVTATEIANLAITSAKVADSAISTAKIAAGAVDAGKLAAAAVTAEKLAALAVNEANIAASAITTAKIADGAIAAAKIASSAVTGDKIAALAVNAANIADNAITTAKVSAGAIDAGKLAANAVTAEKIAALAVNADKIASNAITTAKIADGAIASAKIASGAVDAAKLNIQVGGGNLVTDSSFESEPTTWGTYNNSGNASTRFDTGRNGGRSRVTIAGSTPGSTLGASKPAAVQGGWQTGVPYIVSFYARKVNGASMAGCQLLWNNGPQAATTLANPALTTSWQRYAFRIQWNAGALVPLSGGFGSLWISAAGSWITGDEIWLDDVQVEQADVLTAYAPMVNEILPGTITATQISDNAITTPKLVAGAVAAGKIAASAVSATELAANAVVADKIASNAITAAKIASNAVEAAKIAAGAVTAGKIAANAVTATEIAAGSIVADKIATGAVTAIKVAAGAIEADKIAASAITAEKISAGAVTAGKIAANAVTATEIAAGTITANEIASNAVTAVKIAADAVTAAKIAAGAITTAKLAAGAVTANEIASNAITTAKIATGAVTAGKVAANAITATEIASNAITSAKISAGAVTATQIATNAVTADKITANAITAAKIAAGAVTAGKIAANAVTATEIAAGTITANEIAAGAIVTEKLAVTSLTNLLENPDFEMGQAIWANQTRIVTDPAGAYKGNNFMRYVSGSSSSFLVSLSNKIVAEEGQSFKFTGWLKGQAGNTGTFHWQVRWYNEAGSVIASSNLSISASVENWTEVSGIRTAPAGTAWVQFAPYTNGVGTFSWDHGSVVRAADASLIVDGAITAGKVAANAITANEIAAGTITATEIASNAITSAKITAGAIIAGKIATNAVTAGTIAAGAVTAGKIAANAVTATEISAGAITTAKLAAGAVTANEIGANAVTAVKIATNAVTADKIAANAVTAAKILAGAIDAGKIAAGAVTAEKITSGAVVADKIAAGAITASKLRVTGGGAINYDPMFADSDAWGSDFGSFSFVELSDAPAGRTVLRSNSGGAAYPHDRAHYPIDTAKRYRVRFFARSVGANGLIYFCLRQYSAPGVPCSNNSGRAPYKPAGVSVPTSWTEYSVEYGGADWQPGVKFVKLDWLLNYQGSAGYMEICFPRFEEMSDADLIVDGAIIASKIATNAVTADKIEANAVTAAKIAAGAVTATQISAGAVTAGKIAANSVTATEIAAGTITANEIATNAITAVKIAAGAIEAAKIAAGAIQTASIAAGAVDADRIAASAVTAAKIATNAVTADKITANAITAAKIAAGAVTATQIGAGAVTAGKIAAGAVTATEIATNAITAVKINAGAVEATKIATNAVTADKISAGAVTAGKIAANAVTANEIAAGSITAAKLVISGRGEVLNEDPNTQDISAWIGAGISIITDTTSPTGNTVLRCAGLYQTVLSNEMPLDSSRNYEYRIWVRRESGSPLTYLTVAFYDGSKNLISGQGNGWSLGTFNYFGLVNQAVPASWTEYRISFGPGEAATIPVNARFIRIGLLSNYSETGTMLVTGVRLYQKKDADLIVDGAIVASKISASAVTAEKVAASAITADKIATNAVTADKIISNAVTAAKIAAGAVSADKIAALAITADKIAANAITADKIAAGTITADKVATNFLRSAFVSTGGLDVTEGNNRVRIRPNNVTPILFEVNGQPTFSVNIDGTGFFAGKLADNTVEAAAITDEAKKAINPAYLGGGEKYGTSGTAVRMATGATVDIGTFTSLKAGDRVAIAFRFQEAVEWVEGINGGSMPSYTTSSYTITLQRRIGSTGSFINVTGAINLTITPYSYGGFTPPGEPYEPRVTGYSYDVNQQFTDVLASTSNHVTYRLVVTRTSGSGTTAQGLLRRQFIGEKAAYKLNELRAFSNDRRWTDKETGFSIYTGNRVFTGGQELTIFFSSPAFSEVYSVALAIDVGTAGGEQWNPQYRNLTTSSVVIRNRHNGTVTISYTIYGRVAV